MKQPFDYKSYRDCVAMTLLGSSIVALGIAIGAVLSGVPTAVVDAAMTNYAVPWFLLWYVWCRGSSQIKIYIEKGPR